MEELELNYLELELNSTLGVEQLGLVLELGYIDVYGVYRCVMLLKFSD